MTTDDRYVCDVCVGEYLFEDQYNHYVDKQGNDVYLIHNWHGGCDGQDMVLSAGIVIKGDRHECYRR